MQQRLWLAAARAAEVQSAAPKTALLDSEALTGAASGADDSAEQCGGSCLRDSIHMESVQPSIRDTATSLSSEEKIEAEGDIVKEQSEADVEASPMAGEGIGASAERKADASVSRGGDDVTDSEPDPITEAEPTNDVSFAQASSPSISPGLAEEYREKLRMAVSTQPFMIAAASPLSSQNLGRKPWLHLRDWKGQDSFSFENMGAVVQVRQGAALEEESDSLREKLADIDEQLSEMRGSNGTQSDADDDGPTLASAECLVELSDHANLVLAAYKVADCTFQAAESSYISRALSSAMQVLLALKIDSRG